MTGTPRGSRLREAAAVAAVALQYALGLGTIALVLFIFGVRPDNFARWLISPLGLIVLGVIALLAWWAYRRGRR